MIFCTYFLRIFDFALVIFRKTCVIFHNFPRQCEYHKNCFVRHWLICPWSYPYWKISTKLLQPNFPTFFQNNPSEMEKCLLRHWIEYLEVSSLSPFRKCPDPQIKKLLAEDRVKYGSPSPFSSCCRYTPNENSNIIGNSHADCNAQAAIVQQNNFQLNSFITFKFVWAFHF